LISTATGINDEDSCQEEEYFDETNDSEERNRKRKFPRSSIFDSGSGHGN
jgi:hypothetical protein